MFSTTATVALLQAGVALAGIALPAEPKDLSTPVQQRISFNGVKAVSVAWNTYEQLTSPCVLYGKTTNTKKMKKTCSTHSVTYPSSRTWTNIVVLTGLTPATKYYYQIVSTNTTTNYFQTARAPGDMTPFTMVTLADLGLYGEDGYTTSNKRDIPKVDPTLNHTTIYRIAQNIDSYDFVIHPGDLAYADDWIEDPTNYIDSKNAYTAILETFYTQLAPISARLPYQVSPGNHEADCTEVGYVKGDCPEGQYNFSDFTNRYSGMMPTVFASTSTNATVVANRKKAAALANPPFWYSFDYGMAHVVMINTETDFPSAPDGPGTTLDSGNFGAAGQQLAFVDADLASVDRKLTPWVIVAGHRPWYTNGNGDGCTACQTAFEGLLYKYGVDLAAFGHQHNMQRFLPIYQNVVDPAGMNNPKAPMYTVIGGPGTIEGPSEITPNTTGNAFAYNQAWGYGTLTFYNKTTMAITFINSTNGAILDKSVLYKAHKQQFVSQ